MHQEPDSSRPASDSLFARARGGDQAAWTELVNACYPKVQRVIRRRLNSNRPMRSLFDSTDFANDVFKSLAAKSDRFDFKDEASLVAYLAQAAEQKVLDERRRQHSLKRGLDRTHGLDYGLGDDAAHIEPTAPDATPSAYAVANELREQLQEQIKELPEESRVVIELKQQHYTTAEVAERTGQPVRQIQRLVQRVGKALRLGGPRP
jgi:RNA polymerase sigma-70 factor (ECF subfamily)